jgi:hypothetical protein
MNVASPERVTMYFRQNEPSHDWDAVLFASVT